MLRYQNWKEGQHYDGKDEQCGIIYQQYDWGRWDDDNCYKPLGYICKRREYCSYTTSLSLSRSVLITYPPPLRWVGILAPNLWLFLRGAGFWKVHFSAFWAIGKDILAMRMTLLLQSNKIQNNPKWWSKIKWNTIDLLSHFKKLFFASSRNTIFLKQLLCSHACMVNRFRSLFKCKRLKRRKVVKGLLLTIAKSSFLKLPIYISLLANQLKDHPLYKIPYKRFAV